MALVIHGLADDWHCASFSDLRGKRDRGSISLRHKPGFLRKGRGTLVPGHIEGSSCLCRIEAEQELSLRDLVAVADVNGGDEAALEMLHRLATRFDRDDSRCDCCSVEMRKRSPGSATAYSNGEDREANSRRTAPIKAGLRGGLGRARVSGPNFCRIAAGRRAPRPLGFGPDAASLWFNITGKFRDVCETLKSGEVVQKLQVVTEHALIDPRNRSARRR
ncbi:MULTISPECIES: hypothetical protein [unclassified Chelatococcus]|uniref:hypothetical protein n=1 Tax=Chelatococcus sp. YT9 TaxID=2835635 RepID=UPI0020C06216|nr:MULTISPECIES: hypothetical protein [unclassified Chelatococcus]